MELKRIELGRAQNLIGQRFGKLEVLYRIPNIGTQVAWACKCDCGNVVSVTGSHLKDGHTKSCGCYKKNDLKEDLTGQQFERLTVISYAYSDKVGHTFWNCKCVCGNEVVARRDHLISRKTQSCGCYNKERASNQFTIDLKGQRFGNLVVLERAGSNKNNLALWKCKCDCGNDIITTGICLRRNEVHSCGCTKSYGEHIISKILKDNNISFEQQKIFDNCILSSGYKAKFDFFVDDTYIIEYDGIQHFETGTGWNTFEHLSKVMNNDKIKNEWCKDNNIPLIRIPYTHLKEISIDDLKLETSKFIVKDKL